MIEVLLANAHLVSLLIVGVTFAAIVAYAFWPSLQPQFDEAAKSPLRED